MMMVKSQKWNMELIIQILIKIYLCLMTKEKVLPDNIINIEQVYRD